jgi:formiminotetrahydrofolate cyclodeaminase
MLQGLHHLTVAEFVDKTASGEPVPGGGSVSALAAGLAAALTEMTAGLTLGKKGYEDQQASMTNLRQEVGRLRRKFLEAVDRDTAAYQRVMAAYRMPKGTEEEKKNRTEAIQDALKGACRVPLDVARDGFCLMDMLKTVVKNGNKNAVTDAAVGTLLARAAVRGAILNVRINLSGITDSAFTESMERDTSRIESEIDRRESVILQNAQKRM